MERWKIAIIVIIASTSSIIAIVTIVAGVVFPYVTNLSTPPVIKDWGGLIIGFYFGTFSTVLKDWLGVASSTSSQ